MAKQGDFTFQGSMDGFSFYYDRIHGYLVRRTGGATSAQFLTAPCYAAARDASAEFSGVSQAGKLIRDALSEFILQVKDSSMVNRLMKELVSIKELDTQNPKGKRRPEHLLSDPRINSGFRMFQFNSEVNLCDLLSLAVKRDSAEGSVISLAYDDRSCRIPALTCDVSLLASGFPEPATHAGLSLIRTFVDFEMKCFQTYSSTMGLTAKSDSKEIQLKLPAPEHAAGVEIICLQVLFFSEHNGDLIQLPGKVHAMGIVEVRSWYV